MKRKKIIVAGELNIDLILNDINGFPVVGEEILANDLKMTLGSSSAIFAANIATLAHEVSFCGMVGYDLFGKFIIDELLSRNINTDHVTVSNTYKTGLTVVMNYNEDRANVTYGGAMEHFSLKNIPDNLSRFDHLHLSSYFLQKGLQEDVPGLFMHAKALGMTTSLDLQWDPANNWHFPYGSVLPFVDIFLPNEKEIFLLTKTEKVEDAVNVLKDHTGMIVVKCGSRGAIAYENGKFISSAPYVHNDFVDAIGAGDSFNAGFISKFLTGASTGDCLAFANLCGAMNTTSAGGTAAFETLSIFRNKAKLLFDIEISI